jgi:hypothetical protein
MGTVFAIGSATSNLLTASADAVANGMRLTFIVAAALISIALYIAYLSHSFSGADCDCNT